MCDRPWHWHCSVLLLTAAETPVVAQEPYVLEKLRDTEQTYNELSVSRHYPCSVYMRAPLPPLWFNKPATQVRGPALNPL